MKIKSIKLKNFKRFTHLEIKDIREEVKLVLLTGSNGSGKSSLFDGLLSWEKRFAYNQHANDLGYHRKSVDSDYNNQDNTIVHLYHNMPVSKGCIYLRTAYRNEADFNIRQINAVPHYDHQQSITRVIDNDQTVGKNYQRLIQQTMSALYDTSNNSKSVENLRAELIGAIQTSLRSIFDNLDLDNISDPMGTGTFTFTKGSTKGFLYKNLSGGEKSVFDLLLDLHLRVRLMPEGIYCFDEIEMHLHTSLQKKLLLEIVRIIPDSSQVWISTHSLGVMRAAQELATSQPSAVCVLNFDDLDPDQHEVLTPVSIEKTSLEKMMSIALDDLNEQIMPKHIVLCEGSATGRKRKNFDADIYNNVFNSKYPNTVFISAGNCDQVGHIGIILDEVLRRTFPKSTVHRLIDRDDLSAQVVTEKSSDGVIVLPKRNLESYLLDDELLSALAATNNQIEKSEQIIQAKNDELTESSSPPRNNPIDDLKSCSGKIYTESKRILSLTQCGNNADAFLKDTLAPLLTEELSAYKELESHFSDFFTN